jgi:hypothetical protein
MHVVQVIDTGLYRLCLCILVTYYTMKWSVVRHRYLDVVKTAVLVTRIEFMHSSIIIYEEMVGVV